MITKFPAPITAILRDGARVDVVSHDEALNLFGANGETWSSTGRSNGSDVEGPSDIVGHVRADGRVLMVQPTP